ncbi:MAG: HAMP domain-containing sensor histidine kinase [Alphaproteobacteria bacterium]|nr:HAMP domain-containing sensor histidine kinase [Alphaproteobacteria bacterium]
MKDRNPYLPLPRIELQGGTIVNADIPALAMLAGTGRGVIGRRLTDFVEFKLGTDPLSDPPPTQDGRWVRAQLKAGGGLALFAEQGEAGADVLAVYLFPTDESAAGMLLTERSAPNDALTQLFSNLSHEMLTPLNAVIGFSEVIGNQHFGPVSEQYRNYAKDINASGLYLLAMVKSMLELGKLSSGPEAMDETTVELREILQSAMRIVSGLASQKGSMIDLVGFDEAPTLFADELKLTQVFTNLLSNALKYSQRGSKIRAVYDGVTGGFAVVRVIDPGIGMSEQDIVTAMMPFGRASYSFNAAEPGTGLGLPIARAIVASHGGWLEVKSSPGMGTTVIVALPEDRILSDDAGGLAGLLGTLD